MTKSGSDNKSILPDWSSIRKLGPVKFSILWGSWMVSVKFVTAICGLTEFKPERIVLQFVFWSLLAALIWIQAERLHRRRAESGAQPSFSKP
jgi:hypothetical protein